MTRTLFAEYDHKLYDDLLNEYVEGGLVDYATLKNDPRLDKYLTQLANADSSKLGGRNESVAFWVNAYNAYTLKLITDHYPVSSIMDIKKSGYDSPWSIPLAKVAGKNYSLDQIENDIIRKNWPDPRIHYALVCAAKSCPQLRNEAYTGERLNEQLDEQGRWFLVHRNKFDIKSRKASLSSVYDWYKVDFGNTIPNTLKALVPHVESKLANELTTKSKAWTVTFTDWNWQLNQQD